MTAGRKLEPGLKAVIDRIYRRDPERYRKLIFWVWWNQKRGWKNEVIAEAAAMADENLDGAPDWWAYLTKLLPKASGRYHEKQAADYKKDDLNSIKQILAKVFEEIK